MAFRYCESCMSATTRFSLIARIKDPADSVAWRTFVEIYSPFVYCIGRRYGLQDADACDLVQEVLREVAVSIRRFEATAAAGKFRGWISLITRRTLSRMLKREQRVIATGSGDTVQMMALSQHPAEENDPWENEHRQYVFRWVADQVRENVSDTTWEAFWLTAIQREPPQTAADKLGMTVGSVYIAKSRVQSRLREKLLQLGDEVL